MSLPALLKFDITPPPSSALPVIEVDDETGEENPNFVYDEGQTDEQPTTAATPHATEDEEEKELLQDMIDMKFVEKPPIIEEDIFVERKVGKPRRATSPQPTKRKARKPLSEEDKQKRREALARGRETRARNLRKKKELEAQQQSLDVQEQELNLEDKQLDLEMRNAKLNKKAKKVKKVIIEDSSSSEEEVQYVKRSRKKKPQEPQVEQPSRLSLGGITAEDIERSQLNTLLAYEKLRKDRKQEKQRVKQIEQEQQKIKQTMNEVNSQWGRHRGAGKYGNMLAQMGL